jgi:hypothetical protein
MYLNYSKLAFDKDGIPETPELMLKTLGDKTIGVIPGVYNLEMTIKFSEPSEISFDIPAYIDGKKNPLYNRVTGYKQIYTDCYGIYVTLNPTTEADGIQEVKHVKGYSYEKTLESKKLFLEEGTFNFWNPAATTDTVLGRILEVSPGWHAGYVSSSLVGKYRTFDQYDDYVLSFMYNTAPEKYRCVFVFDTYEKTINVYDADEERPTLPIYLDFDNLLDTIDIEEKSDELVTAIRPYGADELSIRNVNPIGTNWIYDLSYFISNGDIQDPLASKWVAWQQSILSNQSYYRGLTGLRASATARLISAQAALTDLEGELETLTAQQSVYIQALALEISDSGKESVQTSLTEINQKIAAKQKEISTQQGVVDSINDELDEENSSSYMAQINAIVQELSFSNYFTEAEQLELSKYFIEQDLTEETFVATDVDASVSGSFYTLYSQPVTVVGSTISRVDLTEKYGKNMYALTGGSFTTTGGYAISCDVIRGTMEIASDNSYVLSLYAGTIKVGSSTAASGMITLSGTLSGFSTDVAAKNHIYEADNGGKITVAEYEGTRLGFTASGSMYLTANISEYQQYSVEMELYEYAVDILDDLATPTYEFSVDSGNFLFAKEFEPFRNQLELGKGIYLNVGGGEVITPYIIEFELDFEDRSSFSLVFSNRFKRHDNVNTLKDMLETSYSTSRSFDASKYIYSQTSNQMSRVSEFMSSSLETAKNTILGAANESVVIDGAGIHVGGDSKYQIRIVDSMIAMSDDNWASSKLAIGHFKSTDVDGYDYFGVNAEVIGGKLIVGNNLILENATDKGVMQFKVDSSGAWLNNSTFVMQKDSAGQILIDPKYGIAAGPLSATKSVYTLDGTTVTPSFISDGTVTKDDDGFPVNTNFYLDIDGGNAYFRGKLKATSGEIGGFTIEENYLHGGNSSTSYVALNGSGTNANSAYAIWAGNSSPGSAPFYVKKNGDFYAKNGTFSGTLSAGTISGGTLTGTVDGTGGELIGTALKIGANSSATNGYNFYVDSNGNANIKGSITLSAGSSINWANVTESNLASSAAYSAASSAQSTANDASNTASNAQTAANNASTAAQSAKNLAEAIANGTFSGGTFIDNKKIYSPTVYADTFTVYPRNPTTAGSWTGGLTMYGNYGSTEVEIFNISYSGNATTGGKYVNFNLNTGGNAVFSFDETAFHSICRFTKNVFLSSDVQYGTAAKTSSSSGTTGQLYFQIES